MTKATEKAEAAAKKAGEAVETAAAETKATLKDRFDSLRDKMEVPESAREFVKNTAHNAAEQTDKAYDRAAELSTSAEKAVTAMVGGYYNVIRGALEASKANADHYFNTVEKVAGAGCLREAFQIQADAVKESVEANLARGRDAIEESRKALNETVANVQGEMKKVWNTGKAA